MLQYYQWCFLDLYILDERCVSSFHRDFLLYTTRLKKLIRIRSGSISTNADAAARSPSNGARLNTTPTCS